MAYILFREVVEKAQSLILGLKGYSDAGLITTYSIEYLIKKFEAEKIGCFKKEFYDYSVNRPFIVVEDGIIKNLKPPTTEVFYSKNLKTVFVYGSEPNLNWYEFVDGVLSLIKRFEVKNVYSLGGLIDYVREPRVSGVVNNEKLKKVLIGLGVELVNYEGPSSIYSLLLNEISKIGVEAVSLWGHVPYKNYVASTQLGTPDIITAYQLLEKLNLLAKLGLDLDELLDECRRFEKRMDDLIRSEQRIRVLRPDRSEGPPYIA
jgi:predicted ATP-grasp superfamily ATP-dependent carboligase